MLSWKAVSDISSSAIVEAVPVRSLPGADAGSAAPPALEDRLVLRAGRDLGKGGRGFSPARAHNAASFSSAMRSATVQSAWFSRTSALILGPRLSQPVQFEEQYVQPPVKSAA